MAPPAYDAACAAVAYGFPWDGLVAGFKFHAAIALAAPLVALMEQAWRAAQPAQPLPSVLLPVPLSDARLRERGYNQSWELARRLARRLQAPAEASLLLRIRDTPAQQTLPLVARAANVRRAFALEPQRAADVRGEHVMLVDDVMTSGSTVDEIARVLHAAGAARVSVCVFARTPRPGDRAATPGP